MNVRMKAAVAVVTLAMASAVPAAERPVTIAFREAVGTTLCPPQDTLRIGVSLYLRELMRRLGRFREVNPSRAEAAWTRIHSGAYDFGGANAREKFNLFMKADVVCDYYYKKDDVGKWKYDACVLEVWNGTKGERTEIRDKPLDVYGACVRITELLVRRAGVTEAEAKEMRAFAKDAGKCFRARFVTPRIYGHYDRNTGDVRLPALQDALAKYKGDPRIAARVAEAAAVAFKDGRKLLTLKPESVRKLGESATEAALGCADEDLARAYAELPNSRAALEKFFLAKAKPLTLDAATRGMESAIAESEDNVTGDLLADDGGDKPSAPAVSPFGITPDAVARGALKALGWQKSEKALERIFPATAKSKETAVRRTTALALSCYGDAGPALGLLETLAADADAVVATTAGDALLRAKRPCPGAAAAARRVLDGKTSDAGVIGLDPVFLALRVLAAEGGEDDRPRFLRHAADRDPKVRAQALRGLFARTRNRPEDLPWLDDPDADAAVAAINGLKAEFVRAHADAYDRLCKLAFDPSPAVCNAALAALRPCRPADAAGQEDFLMRFGNLYARRRACDAWAEKGDDASLAKLARAADNRAVLVRAHALKLLKTADPVRARAAALKHLGDSATYARFYACYVLADVAEPSDADALKTALGHERNRVARLYLADALARAEGRPKPPALPSVNSVTDRGRATCWMCGYPGERNGDLMNDGYYTCALPKEPTEQVKYAHDVQKAAFFPRPTPIGNPGLIVVDPAAADSFWVTLDAQLPPGVVEYVDGLVYGEESMSLNTRGLWSSSWGLFCEDAGLDPKLVNGDFKSLDDNEKCAWDDWGFAVAIEGYNELHDFTKDYVGKLRPGIKTCSYGTDCGYGSTPYARRMKFDLYGLYIYSGDARRMYGYMRSYRCVWPERAFQWLSSGHVPGVRGPKIPGHPEEVAYAGCTNALALRSHPTYVDSLSVWLAGADTGYFTTYFVGSAFDKRCKQAYELGQGTIYPGSRRIAAALDLHFKGADVVYRDMYKRKARVASDEPGAGLDEDDLELDEEGSADDPVKKAIAGRRAGMTRDLLLRNRAGRDTTSCELGLKRRYPPNCEAFLLGSACYTPAGMLLPAFDSFYVFSQPSQFVGLGKYRLGVVAGAAKARMDEQTRTDWIAWLRDTPAVLVVNGDLARGTRYPYCNAQHPHGDLKTPWPWEADVTITEAVRAKGGKKAVPARYVVGGANAKALARDEFGVTRVRWQAPGFRGTVVFDLTTGTEATWSMRELLAGIFAEKGVKVELSDMPGLLRGEEEGLTVQTMSWHGCVTNVCHGFDLLTGTWNPTLSPQLRCAATAEDYVAPCVAVHGGVCVLAQENPLEVVEKLDGGLKVAVKGLVRVTTKSGRPPKIAGKALAEVTKDPIGWYVEREREEGVATIRPKGVGSERIVWRVLRVNDRTELTLTDE